MVQITPAGMVDNFLNGFGQGSVKEYIKSLEKKPAQALSLFEKEILDLYKGAEVEGRKFCLDQFRKQIVITYNKHQRIIIVLSLIAGLFFLSRMAK